MIEHMGQESLEALWSDIDRLVHDEVIGVYSYQGSVRTYEDLPTLSAGDNGMVYNVIEAHGDYPAGTNWAWTGTEWDALGGEAGDGTYELPTMSATTRGGARVGTGLSVDGDVLSVDVAAAGGITTKSTQGPAYGPLASVTAKGHAEQDGAPTPSDPKEIVVVRGHEVAGKTGRYVDLVVTADGTTTTTPIPLPSRGWVGSLPDGTHDALAIDGAGKVTWELADAEAVFDGSADEKWLFTGKAAFLRSSETRKSANNGVVAAVYADYLTATDANSLYLGTKVGVSIDQGGAFFMNIYGSDNTLADIKAFLAANPVTVLYPLATPTTEDVGYVDLPDIPEGAVVSIPELEGLGVESWTSDAVARYVRAWAARS